MLVCGAGGFIGGHLVKRLLAQNAKAVRCVDIKPEAEWHQAAREAENRQLDLRLKDACDAAVQGVDVVFNLAADMGGMGFIENNKALCMLSVLINTHLLMAARGAGVGRYFFASSACVYNAAKQTKPHVTALKEEDAYPAQPEDGYGWEKLFGERMSSTLRKTWAESAGWRATTMFMGLGAHLTAGGKRLRRRFAGR